MRPFRGPTLLLFLVACGGPPGVDPDRVARTITSADGDMGAVVSGNQAFHWDVTRAVLGEAEGNAFLSPFSMSAALGMTYAGAAGTTRDEMADVLHVDLDDADWHAAFGALVQDLNGDLHRGYTLHVANRLFGQTGYPWKDTFLAVCEDDWGAPLEEVDFDADPDAGRERVNDWVAEQTSDHVTELLPPGSISTDTALVLANAIDFAADWALPFDPEETEEGAFTRADGSTVQVPLMRLCTSEWEDSQMDFAYVDDAAVLRLPYRDDELSMVVVVPDEADGLDALVEDLSPAVFEGWMDALVPQDVYVTLPRFEIRWGTRLAPLLAELGMPSAFSASADLTGMAEDPEGAALYVNEVYHQAWVHVDEAGTEASAATAVVVNDSASGAYLDATRPFLFVIRDDLTGSLLFVGRVSDPSAD